jgi:thymidylate synthase ThyX
MIEAKILADSINCKGNRLTSFILTYPRFIHQEVLTHRVFSRNSASSRAIPVQKMIERIQASPAMPIVWGKNQRGMQASEEVQGEQLQQAQNIWLRSMDSAVVHAQSLLELGIHKQIANRLLEPYAHMTTIVTATEFGNFFNLRAHKDAQPEFQELAFLMLEAYKDSKPVRKKAGEWHLPFADQYIQEGLSLEELLKITTARAARISYLNFEGDIDHVKDYELHDSLLSSGHWSPFEHCARALRSSKFVGNFRGWFPYRKMFANENRALFDVERLLQHRRGTNHA